MTIIPYTPKQQESLSAKLDEIWDFYRELKDYKQQPCSEQKALLEARFDKIFTEKTGFQTLDLALERIFQNKTELLLVLERPEIPLHNNLSENDIRDYVKKRKISATTRSELGRAARDTFLSIKKTCQKLDIAFSDFLLDRLSGRNTIPRLSTLVERAAYASYTLQ